MVVKFATEPFRPQFIRCIELTSDPFWKKIFEDLSINKLPNNVFFKSDHLCIRGKPTQNINIAGLTDLNLFQNVLCFLTNTVGIKSPTEKNQDKQNIIFSDQQLKINKTNFSNIRKKKARDLLIELFAINMKNKYNLSLSQTRLLISNITVKIIFNTLLTSSIIIVDGKIDHIEGLTFSDSNYYFFTPEHSITNTTEKTEKGLNLSGTKSVIQLNKNVEEEVNQVKMVDCFDKFLVEFNKKK